MNTAGMVPTSALEGCRTNVLGALDRAIEKHPNTPEPLMLEVTRCLVKLRDALIHEHRSRPTTEVARELAHANAVLSLVHSVHYPLAGIHWEKLKQVRESFAQLAQELQRG
jgi:hypothetical protein